VKLENVSVTMTFEVETWFLDATHCVDVVNICAKLFQNPSMTLCQSNSPDTNEVGTKERQTDRRMVRF
jgi:hypothetical protein